MTEQEWRAQVSALFEEFEQRLDAIDRRLEALQALERRVEALEAQAAQRRARRARPPPQQRNCLQCGQAFKPKRSDAHYCSSTCRGRAFRAAHGENMTDTDGGIRPQLAPVTKSRAAPDDGKG